MDDPHGIYYLGPKGSFTYEAAANIGLNLKECKTITGVSDALEGGSGRLGVVPLQNSLEGPVNETLDNLFSRGSTYVNSVLELEVRLVLASKKRSSVFRKIYSHSHALREIRSGAIDAFGAQVIPVESTSHAAMLASSDDSAAAICSRLAAEMYGLEVVLDDVQQDNNVTKFAVVSGSLTTDGDRTMLLATLPHRPGGLLKLLEAFYAEGVNLTMIYSRPLKDSLWHYYFLLEFEGCLNQPNIQRCLQAIPREGYTIRLCGSYPIRRVGDAKNVG